MFATNLDIYEFICSHMGRKTFALSLDERIYEKYKKYCEENDMILSRKVETLMKKELEEKKIIEDSLK